MPIHLHRRDRTMKALPSLVHHSIIAVVTAMLLCTAAAASGRSWYVGTSLASPSFEADGDIFESESGPSGAGYALRAGRYVNENMAVDFNGSETPICFGRIPRS